MGYGAPRGSGGQSCSRVPSTGVCDHLPQMDAPGGQEAHHSRGSWREEESIENPTAEAASHHSSDGMSVGILHVCDGPFMAVLVSVLNARVRLLSTCS